jgi:hypothetical protein
LASFNSLSFFCTAAVLLIEIEVAKSAVPRVGKDE